MGPTAKVETLVPLHTNGEHLALTPVELIRIAVSQNADIEKLSKLMDLQERWEAREARKAFNAAMSQFKSNPPDIHKNKEVRFGNTAYKHATLDHVSEVITKGLSAVGITHAWKVSQAADLITVSCVLTHEMGHSEETQLMGVADNSGSKNSIQAIGSTVTYLQRYTLLAACGLAASNDNDGQGDTRKPVVAAEKIEEYIRQMTEVETMKDLQTVFAKAYSEAQGMNDREAMAHYIKAKDARKKELEHANR